MGLKNAVLDDFHKDLGTNGSDNDTEHNNLANDDPEYNDSAAIMLKARPKSQPRRSRKYAFRNVTYINNGFRIVHDEGRLRYESRARNSSSTKGVPPQPKEISLNTGLSGIGEPDGSAERTWMSRAIIFDVLTNGGNDTTSCRI